MGVHSHASSRGRAKSIAALAATGLIATLLTVLPLGASPVSAAPMELVANSGFETDVDANSVPDGWSYSKNGAATAALDPSVSYAGGKSVKLTGGAAADRAFVSEFDRPASPSVRYHASVRVKTASVSAQYVSLIFAFYDSSNNLVSFERTSATQGTHSWELVESYVESPPNATKFAVQAGLEYGSGTVWFDTLSVAQADSQNDSIVNSNFETDADSNLVPDGWSHEVSAGGTATLVSTGAFQGSKAEKLTNSSTSSRAYASQFYIHADENTSYDFSTYLKTSSVVLAGGSNLLGLDVTFYDADHAVLLQKFYRGEAGTHDWVKVSGRETSPAGTAAVTIRVALDFGSGTAWFDKTEMEKAPLTNLVNNPSLEADIDRNGQLDFWGSTVLSGGAFTVVGDTADKGEGSTKLSGTTSASRVYLNQFGVAVEGDTYYRLSLRYKTSSVTGPFTGLSYAVKGSPCDPGNAYGTCTVTQQVLSNVELGATNLVNDSHDWVTVSTVLRTPESAAVIDFRPYLFGSGSMWVDDARIEKLTPSPDLAFAPSTSVTKGSGGSSTVQVVVDNTGTTTAWVDRVRSLEGEPSCNPAETAGCTYQPHPSQDPTCVRTSVDDVTFSTATSGSSGTTAFTVATTGGTYSPARAAFSVPAGESLTLTLTGAWNVDGSQLVRPIQVHEQQKNQCYGFKALQTGYGAMADSTVTDEAGDIVAAFADFDAYLDSTAMYTDPACGTSTDHRCGWKTTHDYLVTPAARGEDSNSITSLYDVYSQMFDMTGIAEYETKARIAADQLVRIQQPDGGFAIPWDYPDPFGTTHSPTESVGPSTGLAITTLSRAYERFDSSAYLGALNDAVDYFTDSPGTTNILWLDEAETKATVPYHSISYTPTINGVVGPDIEVYNVNSLVMEALNEARIATGDTSLQVWIDGLAAGLESSQRPTGSWPYAWRFVGTDPAAYNFVQARAFGDYLERTPDSQIEAMTSDVLGYLGDQLAGFPVLNNDLAEIRGLNMTGYWQNYIAGGLCSQGSTGSIDAANYCRTPAATASANDRTGTAFFQYAVRALFEAGWDGSTS